MSLDNKHLDSCSESHAVKLQLGSVREEKLHLSQTDEKIVYTYIPVLLSSDCLVLWRTYSLKLSRVGQIISL